MINKITGELCSLLVKHAHCNFRFFFKQLSMSPIASSKLITSLKLKVGDVVND